MEKKGMHLNGRKQSTRGGIFGLKHGLKTRVRRLFSVILCASLVAGSVPVSSITALASEDDSDYVYEIDSVLFAESVQKAVADGDYLEKEIKFLGEASETYDEIFEPDGSLYELDRDSLGLEKDKDREKDLSLRVFARITKDIPFDEAYEIDGGEDILFLLQNKTDEEVSVSIHMDGRESEMIKIPAAGDIEVNFEDDKDKEDESGTAMKDEDGEDPEEGDDGITDTVEVDTTDANNIDSSKKSLGKTATDSTRADNESGRGFAGGRGNGSGNKNGNGSASSGGRGRGGNAAVKNEKNDTPDADKDSSVNNDKTSDKPGKEPDKESDKKADRDNGQKNDSTADDRNDGSGKENNKTDDDSGKTDGNRDTDDKKSDSKNSNSNNTNSKGSDSKGSNDKNSGNNNTERSGGSSNRSNDSKDSDKGSSTSGSGSSNDKEKADKQGNGEKTASISVHSGNILAAGTASESDAEKASPSDATKTIEGITYDPVRIGRYGAVAFVTNTESLGLAEIDLSGIVSDAQIYGMSLDALCDAVEYEVNEGEPLEEDDESYLYEISPEFEDEAEGLTLRTFVKINKTPEESEGNQEVETADSEDKGYADPAYPEEEPDETVYIEEGNDESDFVEEKPDESAYIEEEAGEDSYPEAGPGYTEYAADEGSDDSYGLEYLSDSTVYYVTGEEEIYFLLTNETDEAVAARILVASSDDIYETERLIVPGNGVTKVSVSEDDEDYGIMYLESVYEDTVTDEEYPYNDGYIAEADTNDEYAYDDGCTAMDGTVYEEVSDAGEPEVVYVTTLGNLGVDYGIKLLAGGVAEVTADGAVIDSYDSLAEAITAANEASGDEVTVTLLADVTETIEESNHFTISRGMTIDLGGHTIYVSGDNANYRLFYIDDLDEVTIKFTNGTVDGTVDGEKSPCYFIYDYRGSKKRHDLVIDDLTVQNFGACTFGTIYQQSSNFTATNSTFKDNDTRAFCIQNYASLTSYRDYSDVMVEGCTIENNNYETTRTGTETVTPNNTTGYAGYAAMGGGFFINWANSVTITGNTVKGNSAQLNGGGFMVCGSYNTDIEENNISGNKTTLNTVPWMNSPNNYNPNTGGGGGFTVYRPAKDVYIRNNIVTDNSSYGLGGGFLVTHNNWNAHVLGDIYIEGNTVSENTVAPFDWNNMAHGGGIAIYNVNGVHEAETSVIRFTGNTITDNKAEDENATSGSTSCRGGGLSLVDGDSTTEFIIDSGKISGNSADIGGGIDLTLPYNEADADAVGASSVLKLYNVEVTENSAVRGGGLWTNPSSKTEMYTENSNHGVIYGNTASGSFTYDDGHTYQASGDDICYEGADSDLEEDGELEGTDGEVKADSKLTIVNVDLGGSQYDWYTDEADARYKDASDPSGLLVDSYTFRDTVDLHADLTNPNGDYELFITENTAKAYGGGIASDATIYFGDDSEIHENEVDVIVTTTTGGASSTVTTTYNTLAEAVDAANEVDDSTADVTLKLNRDIVVNLNLDDENDPAADPVNVYATVTRGITLDLNTNTIDVRNGDAEKYMLEIDTTDPVTITNGTIDGHPTGAESTSAYIVHSKGSAGACNSLTLSNLSIIDFNESVYGTIYTEYCNLSVTDCTFKDNNTRGFYFTGGSAGSHEAALVVSNCTFDTNTATEGSTSITAFGGGFYAEYAGAVAITGCNFDKNGDHGRSEDFMYLEGGGGFYLYNCGKNSGSESEVKPFTTSDSDDNITITGNTFTENTALSRIFEHTVDFYEFWKTGGGGFNLFNTVGEVKIKNNKADSNRAFSWGGGISIMNEETVNGGYLGNMDIFDNEITNNILYDTMYKYTPDTSDNTVQHRCEGGGIAVIDRETSHGYESVKIDFEGNIINGNTCGTRHTGTSDAESKFNRGGGMSLYGADENGVEFNLLSGEVCDNVADTSGGINFTEKNAYNVRLYNAIITKNTAFRGGGVWLCPTSETTFFETFGGAIYNNTAETNNRITGGYWFPADSLSCGDDIRYEGNDSDLIAYLWNDQQEYQDWVNSGSKTVCSVSSRALGGYQYDWYMDGMYALNPYSNRNPYSGAELYRYKDASDKSELYIPLETILKTATVANGRYDGYKQREGSFSLHAELSDEAIAHAEEEASFLISRNKAYFVGGGIGSNCQFYFGLDADEKLAVEKYFVDENGKPIGEKDENGDPTRVEELPEYVKVELVRDAVDEDGNLVVDEDGNSKYHEELEVVELNADNDWRYEFEDLELVLMIVGNGDDPDAVIFYDWEYSIKEIEVGKSSIPDSDDDFYWVPTVETGAAISTGTVLVKMTNYRRLAPKLTKEEFEDDYERKDEDTDHDDENGHFEENIEGDGWGSWDDADNNQEITYHVKVEHIKDTYKMTIHDYLEEGLDFESGTVNITLYNSKDETNAIPLEEGEDKDYVISEGDCSDPDCPKDGCTFEVRFADYLFDPEDDPDNPDQEPLHDDAWILLEYKALTDTHAGDYFEGDHEYEDVILNDAWLDCTIALTGLSFRSIPYETETDLFGFGIYKYAVSNGEEVGLEGAEFMLSEQALLEDGSRGATRYATFDPEVNEDLGNAYMITGWVEDESSAGTLISGEDGMIRIEGLDDDTYTLIETKAPSGYETMAESFTIVIGEDGSVTVDGLTGSKELVDSHIVNVENLPSDEIKPATGDLTISKTVTGSGASKTADFNFTLELSGGEAGETYDVIDGNGNIIGQITFDENGNAAYEFTLKHGESITVKDLPEGIEYTITETDSNGYTVNISGVISVDGSSGSGTISSDGIEVTFTNSRGSSTSTGSHHGSSGGGGGTGSGSRSGGSTTEGPGVSSGDSGDDSNGEDDIQDLHPLSPTGESNKMMFGIMAFVISMLALAALLWYRRRYAQEK